MWADASQPAGSLWFLDLLQVGDSVPDRAIVVILPGSLLPWKDRRVVRFPRRGRLGCSRARHGRGQRPRRRHHCELRQIAKTWSRPPCGVQRFSKLGEMALMPSNWCRSRSPGYSWTRGSDRRPLGSRSPVETHFKFLAKISRRPPFVYRGCVSLLNCSAWLCLGPA